MVEGGGDVVMRELAEEEGNGVEAMRLAGIEAAEGDRGGTAGVWSKE